MAERVEEMLLKAANKGGGALVRSGPLETRRECPFWLKADRPAIWVEYRLRMKSANDRQGAGYYSAIFELKTEGPPETLWESQCVVPDVTAPGDTEFYTYIDYCDLTGDGVSEVILKKVTNKAQQFQVYELNGKTLACVATTDAGE